MPGFVFRTGLVQPAGYQMHELLTGVQVREETAGEGRGGGDGILLLHTPYLHAHVLRLYHHCNPQRLEILLDAVPYLGGESLLHLQPGSIGLNNPRYLAQTGDVTIRYICHMSLAMEWQHVMLTHRIDINVFHYNHLTVLFSKDGAAQYLLRV